MSYLGIYTSYMFPTRAAVDLEDHFVCQVRS